MITWADRLLIALVLPLLAASYWWLWGDAEQAAAVQVHVGEHLHGEYPLQDERLVQVPGQLGTSTLRIEAGQVRFVDSPCRNKICVHSGWQRLSGAAAACLPNRVSFQLVGGAPAMDAMSF